MPSSSMHMIDNISLKVIAATNRIDILDPALLRSGRLDRKIEFPLPNETARARILEIHSRKMTCSPDVNYEELARSTDEFNGAQLKAVCVEAGMIALREGATKLSHEHFLSGIAEGTVDFVVLIDELYLIMSSQCKAKRRTTSCISHNHCTMFSGYIIQFPLLTLIPDLNFVMVHTHMQCRRCGQKRRDCVSKLVLQSCTALSTRGRPMVACQRMWPVYF